MTEITNVVNIQKPWPVPPIRVEGEDQVEFRSRQKAWAVQTALHVDPSLLDPHGDAEHGANSHSNPRIRWAADRILREI